MTVALAAVAALASGAGEARAQLVMPEPPKPASKNSVTGSVMLERKGSVGERLEVILSSTTGGGRIETYADSSGRFSFRDVVSGGYLVTVRAPYGSRYEDGSAQLSIFENGSSTNYEVSITLKLRETTTSAPSTVAVDPDAAVPKPARKAYERGLAAAGKGDGEEAVRRFREALGLAPDYRAALNDLGVQLLKLDRAGEAVPVLRHATELGPSVFAPRLNLALALHATRDLDAAEAEVAKALALEPGSTRALYAGGRIALDRGKVDEAVKRLERAYAAADETQPAVAYALGGAYEAAGDTPHAVEAYRAVTYLEPFGARSDDAHARLHALGAE